MKSTTVTTKKGKNKDQYGRKFGKKHNEAMLEFTKSLWLQDSTTSLKNLLQLEVAQKEFLAFLRLEYGEAQLEFFLEAQRLESMDPSVQGQAALQIYSMFINTGGKGIGHQERTSATQDMWDAANLANGRGIDPTMAINKIREEADITLKMLAFDAFPRFIKSPGCANVMAALRSQGGNPEIERMMNQAGSKVPQDADDWLNIFVATAESFPACIVISDMTIPGAPMIYVNKEFCRVTQYTREEATGRNCRFLQGPETEPEAIQVIRNTLCKGQDCHVKLTNYRKNGDMFQNLLSMKPVFDADGIYRYVIGVQFEIKEDENLKVRLVQLDKLLRLLPSKLNLRSKAASRAKGALAVKVSGEANQMIGNKEAVLQQAKQMESQEQNTNRPKALGAQAFEIPMAQLNMDNTVFAYSKIMWLNYAADVMPLLFMDPLGKEMLGHFVRTTCTLYQVHFDFLNKFFAISSAQGTEQGRLIRKFHLKRNKNCMFYCAATEIPYGSLNSMNWGPIFNEMQVRAGASMTMLASDLLPKFLNSKVGYALCIRIYQREVTGQIGALRTVAAGLDRTSESFWLDMFRVMSESCSIGVVVSDMTVPGIPLVHINEGFRAVTGYGKEKIGCSCRFLQGPDTESYLNDEIMAALQQAEPLLVKLHNYKANGQKFQCLLALHPVMGPGGEYKYQVGVQLDFCLVPDITRQLLEMERLLQFMPRSVTGEDAQDVLRIVPSNVMGDANLYPMVSVDPSEVKAPAAAQPVRPSAPSIAAAKGFGGMSAGVTYGGAPKRPATAAAAQAVSSQGVQAMEQGKEVVTQKGKGKDQYGRTFGKKQKAAMLEFTKTLWLQDAVTSLKNLLQMEVAQQQFLAFLRLEYGEAQLEFFLEAERLERVDANTKAQLAPQIYQMFIATGGKGIGQQERTATTQQMWDYVNQSGSGGGVSGLDPATAIRRIREEADTTLKMLAFDAFPRFVKSKQCQVVMQAIQSQGGNAQVEGMLAQVGDQGPKDADDWLNMFVATAESFPACIVISDMTIPGAPMIYVNKEFCRVTQYTREEATGRNCRFLQGPETEPEAIQVIRNTLCKGQDCHVKLTNYRKNGEKFQNLLSMKPVFDADGIYRYVIGVQFEIKEDQKLKERLIQLDKLLRLLPSKLNLRSKAASRAKGALAVKVSGEANQMIGNKEAVLQQAKQAEIQEMAQIGSRPKAIVSTAAYDPKTLNYDRTVAAFTKIMWLQDPVDSCRNMMVDPMCLKYFLDFTEGNCGSVVCTHVRFFEKAMKIRLAQGANQLKMIRTLHMKKNHNELFYCTTTEIDYGDLNSLKWGPVFENLYLWQEQTSFMLAAEAFPQFMEHPSFVEMVAKLRQREAAGEGLPCTTAAVGVNPQSESLWLDMFQNMAEFVSIGMVISDMTVPGIPLVHINEGFRAVTGYGKEKIGCSCRFLQGAETESYLNDEIMAALQQSEPLLTKLHNYKADGTKFQCLFALHPVFGPAPDLEYKYQVGLQVDFNTCDPELPRKVAEMGRVLRHLPQTVSGEPIPAALHVVDELEALAAVTNGGARNSPGGPTIISAIPSGVGVAGGKTSVGRTLNGERGMNVNGVIGGDMNGNGMNVGGMNGGAMNGNSMNGRVINGGAMNGNGMNGRGNNGGAMNGNGMSGGGMNGGTMNGNGMSGGGMNGGAMNGNGMNVGGMNGNGMSGGGMNGNGMSGGGMNGGTMNGNGMSGGSMNGGAMNGNGMSGGGMNGRAMNGNGMNVGGMNGNGMNGGGMSGGGMNGNEVNGGAMNGNGMNGSFGAVAHASASYNAPGGIQAGGSGFSPMPPGGGPPSFSSPRGGGMGAAVVVKNMSGSGFY